MRVLAIHGVAVRHIDPGSPWQSVLNERFNGTLRVFGHFPYYMPATGNRPASSVREGRWKYYRFYEESPELYDLATDLGETNNLARKEPDVARRLDAALREHLERTGAVLPIPNPKHDPAAPSPMTADGKRRKGRVLVT